MPISSAFKQDDPLAALIDRKTFRIVFWIILVLLMLFAFQKVKLVDDAFISFRYAKNLVEGHGLVFNPGERIEGYSNFLWVILMAGGINLGIFPELFSIIISALVHFSCLIMSYLLALRMFKNFTLAMIVMLLVGTNWTVASFATSGLETPLQMLEFLITTFIVVGGIEEGWNFRRCLILSLVLNIALLTRPDAIVLVVVAIGAYIKTRGKPRAEDLPALAAPFILLLLPYLIWKATYYGSITPNSFHAKVHGFTGAGFGLFYLHLFILSYLLFPYIFILLLYWKNVIKSNLTIGFTGVLSSGWIVYVVLIGGDFMEFRFFIPIIPLILVFLIAQIRNIFPDKRVAYLLIAGLFLGTINNSLSFGSTIRGWGVQQAAILSRPLSGPGENWIGIGKKLKEYFGGRNVTIALGSCGAIPYYSELKTVDMLGINDAVVPEIGNGLGVMAGHRIIAPLYYLRDRGVNLVLWPNNFNRHTEDFHDWIKRANWESLYRYYLDIDRPVNGVLINEANLLGIPIDESLFTVAWYLTPHPAIDEVARENGFVKVRIGRTGYRSLQMGR